MCVCLWLLCSIHTRCPYKQIKQPAHHTHTHSKNVNPAIQLLQQYPDLVQFTQMWRENFVKTNKPQHLPPHWGVDRDDTTTYNTGGGGGSETSGNPGGLGGGPAEPAAQPTAAPSEGEGGSNGKGKAAVGGGESEGGVSGESEVNVSGTVIERTGGVTVVRSGSEVVTIETDTEETEESACE